jgi:3-methyl-2-oxobutanoate hydroxymethyltransferase
MHAKQDKITVPAIQEFKKTGKKLVACTAYDYTMAAIADAAGIDLILVGDSVGTVIQGEENTISVTLEEMLYHCRCVSKAVSRALVVGDLPFMSYQPSIQTAVESACRMLKEGKVSAVKLEGGIAVYDTIARLTELDIPVVGHIGLTPQSYHRMGGHKKQGLERGNGAKAGSRERIMADARAVANAGAFAVVLEGIPADLAYEISVELEIPTIGIGAGSDCSGQILVINDLLGLCVQSPPSFVKQYANFANDAVKALRQYSEEVKSGEFPIKGAKVKPLGNGQRLSRI